MAYWIRKAGKVVGPLSKEDVEERLRGRMLGSLDEVSTDRKNWVKFWKSEFWKRPQPATREQESRALKSGGFVHPRSRLSPEQLRATTPPSPIEGRRAQEAEPPPLSGRPERAWALPTREEELLESTGGSRRSGSAAAADFSIWRVLFGGVFHRHSEEELSAILSGKSRTPENGAVPTTWLWFRVFLVSTVLSVVLLFLAGSNSIALPGFFFVAAFGTPTAALIFFQECNVTGRISGWKTISVFLVGGILSILVTQLFNETVFAQTTYEIMDAAGAGAIEEPAKAVILLWFASRGKRYPFILHGLLLGAAVGAGFGAFETAGYIFNAFMDGLLSDGEELGFGLMTYVAVLRGILAPFMHIAWTAAIGGAMWTARGPTGHLGQALFSWRTLGAFALSIGLHTLWNAGLSGSWLSLIAWIPLIHYLRRGIAQCVSFAKTTERTAT